MPRQGPRQVPRNAHLLSHIQIGDEIEVWWPHDQTYYPGRVTKNLPQSKHRVHYEDGEVEDLRLSTEQWRFRGEAAKRVQTAVSDPSSNPSSSAAPRRGRTPPPSSVRPASTPSATGPPTPGATNSAQQKRPSASSPPPREKSPSPSRPSASPVPQPASSPAVQPSSSNSITPQPRHRRKPSDAKISKPGASTTEPEKSATPNASPASQPISPAPPSSAKQFEVPRRSSQPTHDPAKTAHVAAAAHRAATDAAARAGPTPAPLASPTTATALARPRPPVPAPGGKERPRTSGSMAISSLISAPSTPGQHTGPSPTTALPLRRPAAAAMPLQRGQTSSVLAAGSDSQPADSQTKQQNVGMAKPSEPTRSSTPSAGSRQTVNLGNASPTSSKPGTMKQTTLAVNQTSKVIVKKRPKMARPSGQKMPGTTSLSSKSMSPPPAEEQTADYQQGTTPSTGVDVQDPSNARSKSFTKTPEVRFPPTSDKPTDAATRQDPDQDPMSDRSRHPVSDLDFNTGYRLPRVPRPKKPAPRPTRETLNASGQAPSSDVSATPDREAKKVHNPAASATTSRSQPSPLNSANGRLNVGPAILKKPEAPSVPSGTGQSVPGPAVVIRRTNPAEEAARSRTKQAQRPSNASQNTDAVRAMANFHGSGGTEVTESDGLQPTKLRQSSTGEVSNAAVQQQSLNNRASLVSVRPAAQSELRPHSNADNGPQLSAAKTTVGEQPPPGHQVKGAVVSKSPNDASASSTKHAGTDTRAQLIAAHSGHLTSIPEPTPLGLATAVRKSTGSDDVANSCNPSNKKRRASEVGSDPKRSRPSGIIPGTLSSAQNVSTGVPTSTPSATRSILHRTSGGSVSGLEQNVPSTQQPFTGDPGAKKDLAASRQAKRPRGSISGTATPLVTPAHPTPASNRISNVAQPVPQAHQSLQVASRQIAPVQPTRPVNPQGQHVTRENVPAKAKLQGKPTGSQSQGQHPGRAASSPARPRSMAPITQNVEKGTASLPLEVLKHTIADSNRIVLQSQLGPISSKIDKLHASKDLQFKSVLTQLKASEVQGNEMLDGLKSEAVSAAQAVRKELSSVSGRVEVLGNALEVIRTAVAKTPTKDEVATTMNRISFEVKDAVSKVQHLAESMREIKRDMTAAIDKAKTDFEASIQQVHERDANARNEFEKEVLADLQPIMKSLMREISEELQKESAAYLSKAIYEVMNTGIASPGGAGEILLPTSPGGRRDSTSVGSHIGKDTPALTEGDGQGDQQRDEQGETKETCTEQGESGDGGKNGVNGVTGGIVGHSQLMVPEARQSLESDKQKESNVSKDGSNHQDEKAKPSNNASKNPGEPLTPAESLADESLKGLDKETITDSQSNRKEATEGVQDGVDGRKEEKKQNGSSSIQRAPLVTNSKLIHSSHELLGCCIVEWLLSGGSRQYAPITERTAPVTDNWVRDSCVRCLRETVRKLAPYEHSGQILTDLSESLSHVKVELAWLTQGPTQENLAASRRNYAGWEPRLHDFEWESEKRVVAMLAHSIIEAGTELLEQHHLEGDDVLVACRKLVEATDRKIALGRRRQ